MSHVSEGSGSSALTVTPVDLHIKLPLPAETSSRFAALPEWIIDDLADFLLFALQ